MPTPLHQEFNRTTGNAVARMATFSSSKPRWQKKLAPVANAWFDRMDAMITIEKDGTGIGTGYDNGRRPVLGAWSGVTQDVLTEHGCSQTLVSLAPIGKDATAHGFIC